MELTTADSSRDVVATAARLDTMCLVRGDIPLVMFVLLCLLFRLIPHAGSMLGACAADICQGVDTTGEMTPGRTVGHDPGAS
jgi:hypothetical protein